MLLESSVATGSRKKSRPNLRYFKGSRDDCRYLAGHPATLVADAGAPGQELAVGHQLIGKTSRSAMPSAIAEGWHMWVCQSFAPGHTTSTGSKCENARESGPCSCGVHDHQNPEDAERTLPSGLFSSNLRQERERTPCGLKLKWVLHLQYTSKRPLRRLAACEALDSPYCRQPPFEVTNSALCGSATSIRSRSDRRSVSRHRRQGSVH